VCTATVTMDMSRKFLHILQSIDYYVGHLHKDLLVNEEQHPDLLSIFTWLVSNVSPKSNCVTPKELELYTSILSKHDQYISLEKVSQAINKFYGKSTKDSVVCSTDLECLEKKILKSQQELDDLKAYGTLYEKKNNSVDHEISLLRDKENCVKLSRCNAEKDLELVLRTFMNTIDTFGFSVKKLNNNIIDSMKNKENNLIHFSSKNLMNIIRSWQNHILEMAHTFMFNEENSSSERNHKYSSKIQMLCLLYQSITAFKSAEMIEQSEIAILNTVLNNISALQSYYYENNSYLHRNGLDITDFLAKHVQHCQIFIDSNEHSTSIQFDDLQSCVSDVTADCKQKCSELESFNTCIIHLHDSIEYYMILCDVVWSLTQTTYYITNLKCELVLRCTENLDKIIDDIKFINNITSEWNSNQSNKLQLLDSTTPNYHCTAFDFSKMLNTIKCNIQSSSDEIEKQSALIHKWKNKFLFSKKTESIQLAAIAEKLRTFNHTLNELLSHK